MCICARATNFPLSQDVYVCFVVFVLLLFWVSSLQIKLAINDQRTSACDLLLFTQSNGQSKTSREFNWKRTTHNDKINWPNLINFSRNSRNNSRMSNNHFAVYDVKLNGKELNNYNLRKSYDKLNDICKYTKRMMTKIAASECTTLGLILMTSW